MRRRILVGLPILAAALVFFGLWIANKLTTPPWKSELNQYIDFKASPPNPPITINRAIQASQPWKFTSEMSAESYSDCFYFETTYCYSNGFQPNTPVPMPFDDLGGALLLISSRIGATKWNEFLSINPLLFPPDDLWCVLVKTTARIDEKRWVVYIAKHVDLYTADWITHESSKSISDPILMDDLKTIGCGNLLKSSK